MSTPEEFPSTVCFYNPFWEIAAFKTERQQMLTACKLEDTYWLMKWLKLLHHCSGFRNVGEGFLEKKKKKNR